MRQHRTKRGWDPRCLPRLVMPRPRVRSSWRWVRWTAPTSTAWTSGKIPVALPWFLLPIGALTPVSPHRRVDRSWHRMGQRRGHRSLDRASARACI